MLVDILRLPGFPVRVELMEHELLYTDQLKLKFRIVYNGKAFFYYRVFKVDPTKDLFPLYDFSHKKMLSKLYDLCLTHVSKSKFENEVYDMVKVKLIRLRESKREIINELEKIK